MRKILSLLVLAAVAAVPVTTLAQEAGDACVAGQRDARHDVNGLLWFAMGCVFPILGLVAAFVIEPSPPAIGLVGKSSEYVAAYTDCYKDKARDIQTHKALIGFLCVPTLGIALLWL